MRRLLLGIACFVLVVSSTLDLCNPQKQHCFQIDLRHAITPVPDEYFNSRVGCGLNVAKIQSCKDPFCRAVKAYSETKARLLKALSDSTKDMKAIEQMVKSLDDMKVPLMSAGLTAEQVFNIPVPSNFTCQKLLTPEQKEREKKLSKMGKGIVKKPLYKDRYPVQDVFSEKDPTKFDLCKIDAIVRAERGATPQISNGMAQGLKLYANNQQTMNNYAMIPDVKLRDAMKNGLKQQREDYIRDFAVIGITEQQLESLPLTDVFEDYVKRECNQQSSKHSPLKH